MSGYRKTHTCEWEDSGHTIRRIQDLDTSHLKNIERGFVRGETWGGQESKRKLVRLEIRRRERER